MRDPLVTDITMVPAPPSDRRRGLLAFLSFTVGKLRLDGVAVRRTRSGEIVLSFPKRRDRNGLERSLVRPTDAEARRRITFEVLKALDLRDASDTPHLASEGGNR